MNSDRLAETSLNIEWALCEGIRSIASDADLSVMGVAEIVQEVAREERGINVDVELVENPRSAERMVEEFAMDTSVISWDGNATRMW